MSSSLCIEADEYITGSPSNEGSMLVGGGIRSSTTARQVSPFGGVSDWPPRKVQADILAASPPQSPNSIRIPTFYNSRPQSRNSIFISMVSPKASIYLCPPTIALPSCSCPFSPVTTSLTQSYIHRSPKTLLSSSAPSRPPAASQATRAQDPYPALSLVSQLEHWSVPPPTHALSLPRATNN